MAVREVRPLDLIATAEVELLDRGLLEWSGPARCTDEFAVAMGFQSYRNLIEEGRRLRRNLNDNTVIDADDWTRILLAVEIAFVSDLAGSGVEWSTTTGYADEYTIAILRSIQRKVAVIVRATDA
ncbi:hypothetical protein [Catenulispora acidiphila]|uniref:hypothetical protein n=1 Tax=Catenulispora acidiphila TaxID=304895 RepID=UPI00117CE650|nr:hypothetical protein [Catenulispora acidiphila]